MATQETFNNALLMIASTRAALKNGVKHYDKAGRLLATELAIMEALRSDGSITFDTSERVQRTTDDAEIVAVQFEYGFAGN